MQLRRWAWCLCIAAAFMAACSPQSDDPMGRDMTVEIQHAGATGMYRGLVYVPASARSDRPSPLVVVVHGANTTAEVLREITRFDRVARREGFIVMYPDHAADSAHPLHSWRFYNPAEMQRGTGDAEALAALTQQVVEGWNIDPERVYVVGLSAGGFMASILGAAYPDLYAAIGLVEAGGYGIGLLGIAQPVGPALLRPEITARAAYNAMGDHARIVPVINFQGDQDPAVRPETGAHAVRQWLMTNNLVSSGSLNQPFSLTPAETTRVVPERGYPYQVDVYRDGDGCRVVEQVRIERMGHYWPGEPYDPGLAGIDDPSPDGAALTWSFFKRYRLSDTALPCVESKR
jgi:poly(hydroxyalkanoate) depolymerase family esterase